jgi:hypothetical protein
MISPENMLSLTHIKIDAVKKYSFFSLSVLDQVHNAGIKNIFQ